MSNFIVNLNVTSLTAPAPITLQQQGSFISVGATTLPDGVPTLIPIASALTQYLAPPASLTGITQSAGTATATSAAAHNVPSGQTFVTTIAGATGSTTAYNGTFIATATGAETFTFAVPAGTATPATGTLTFTPYNQGELVNRVNNFFAQGSLQPCYVTEFGAGTSAAGVSALAAYLASPYIQPNGQALPMYIWGLPGAWANGGGVGSSIFPNYNTDGSLVYFILPVTASTYASFAATPPYKCLSTVAPAVNAPATEGDVGGIMWKMLTKGPSSATTKLTPLAYNQLQAVTPYGVTATQAAAFQAANVNYVDTGAEGGISAAILKLGRMMDGNDFSFWYAVDWTNLNLHQTIANTIINGNNNPINPVVYNQPGIDTLQTAAQGVINNGGTFGVINNATPVAAIPFVTYTAQNPSHYAQGIYNGLSVTIVPQVGFISVTFNLQISSFGVAGAIPTS